MSKEHFENWKQSFIIANFADNDNFKISISRKSEPFAPELNVWTSQPKNAIKTQKHL
jgi:hypothetical protein